MIKKNKSSKNSKADSKGVVNFKPESPDSEPTRYKGQTQAADTLRPNSSERRAAENASALAEAVLDITQRRKRANLMRRLSSKLTRLRMMAKNQIAPEARLKFRARKMARSIVRSKFAGSRGREYKDLATSDKIAVDKLIQNKQKLVNRIASRLLPVARKAEMLRLQSVRKKKKPKSLSSVGHLGMMPKIKLDRHEDVQRHEDMIAEAIAFGLMEGKTEKIDQLLKAGLADRDSIMQYKKALENPDYAKRYSVLRDKVFDMMDKLLDVIANDSTIFVRTKDKVQKKYFHQNGKDDVKEEITEAKKLIRSPEQAKKDLGAIRTAIQMRSSMRGKKSAIRTLPTGDTDKAEASAREIATGLGKKAKKQAADRAASANYTKAIERLKAKHAKKEAKKDAKTLSGFLDVMKTVDRLASHDRRQERMRKAEQIRNAELERVKQQKTTAIHPGTPAPTPAHHSVAREPVHMQSGTGIRPRPVPPLSRLNDPTWRPEGSVESKKKAKKPGLLRRIKGKVEKAIERKVDKWLGNESTDNLLRKWGMLQEEAALPKHLEHPEQHPSHIVKKKAWDRFNKLRKQISAEGQQVAQAEHERKLELTQVQHGHKMEQLKLQAKISKAKADATKKKSQSKKKK